DAGLPGRRAPRAPDQRLQPRERRHHAHAAVLRRGRGDDARCGHLLQRVAPRFPEARRLPGPRIRGAARASAGAPHAARLGDERRSQDHAAHPRHRAARRTAREGDAQGDGPGPGAEHARGKGQPAVLRGALPGGAAGGHGPRADQRLPRRHGGGRANRLRHQGAAGLLGRHGREPPRHQPFHRAAGPLSRARIHVDGRALRAARDAREEPVRLMRQVFSAAGFREMRLAWAALALAILAAIGIVAGSHWYGEKEKRDSADYSRRLREARARVESARRERDNLQQSADVFRTLVDRGMLQTESRLDVVELLNTLRVRYQLSRDYEIAPQRTLALPGGRVFQSVDGLASRVKLKARALHEGDMLGFLDALEGSSRGFYPVDKCTMRRVDVADADSLQPRVEAECTLEWITLKDKHANRPA